MARAPLVARASPGAGRQHFDRRRARATLAKALWSCLPTAIPRRPASSSTRVVERMMEAVHHYEGTVNEVRGNGIMALFGAPLAHE